ncbi:serine hydrolase [Nocardiopsis alkaliphila]|uniref:serine hydrolase n=1 Tax=Nocardiopsis alkaliphila TaxID=225762 RepID=UPI0003459DB0|nr:serine hydrolase [Nocardiopsis alkaliphila]
MPWRLPAQRRVWSLATSVLLALCLLPTLPGATSAGAVAVTPQPSTLARLVETVPHPLVPFAPITAPATGGSALTPDERAALDERIAALGEGVELGVAVQDLRTGTTYSHNAGERLPSASVAKLTVLAMLHLRAAEEGRGLTSVELAQAEVMIRYSDNDVTDGLYARMGFTDGFVRHAQALGFTGTEPHPKGSWGSTMTTPADQIRLLRALYTDEGPLTDDARAHIRGLMESVAPEQAWGVSAAASAGDLVGLKNGWTPRESNGGLWNINSVGYVVGQDREYLIAVMSDRHTDYVTGTALVEELVAEVVRTLEAPAPHEEATFAGAPPH